MIGYYQRLQLPLALLLASVIVPAAAFCLAVVLFRAFFRRGQPWLAALAFPCLVIAYEYLISLSVGTFNSTAYTQLKNLPVLQLGALAGLWSIGFAVMLFPSMIAAILLSPARPRRQLSIAFAAIHVCVLGYGVWRLSTAPNSPPQTISIGVVASDLPQNTFPDKDPDAMRLLREYADQVKLLAQRGARIAVMPEMTALVRESISADVDALFRQTAREANIQIVVGVLHATGNGTFNEARLYPESGAPPVVYRKRHLVPVVEGRTTPENDFEIVRHPAGIIGLAICRDMDYPDPARQYGQAQAGLVLVPAWDFDIDRYWHGHLSILRGVENGFTVARAAKNGLLFVSDSRGRILAETRTTPELPFTTMLATVPVHHAVTLYQFWGDWFAWFTLAVLGALLITFVARRPARTAPETVKQSGQLSS
ncbi:MAG: nitrilase-related carbon-nitrogen hydrolase [Rhodospirillales bacterium]